MGKLWRKLTRDPRPPFIVAMGVSRKCYPEFLEFTGAIPRTQQPTESAKMGCKAQDHA
jgi:hypothetical protein